MDPFYRELEQALESAEGDIWTETVLEGEHRGEKRLLSAVPDEEITVPKSNPDVTGTDGTGCRVFRERIGRTPKLIVCGGGHVSVPIIQIGKMLGFTVTVLEDRPKFADHARAAGADTVICQEFGDGLAQIKGDSDSWFVIVTRGHRYDAECLEKILRKDYAYVGMMGSRRRVSIVKEQLEQKGVNRERLDGVHTPIGLKIKAQTPEEIAVSVMAEIIEIKNSRGMSGGYSAELLEALLDGQNPQKRVLATIISRKGSAPRGVGTKMLILEDGNTIDTIGGGCVESEIIQTALLMMRTGEPVFQIRRVDMTTDVAEEEGMVCGGVVEVMLEVLF